MGGAIGTVCAAACRAALQGRIASLVLNDNAPQLADAAIERIRGYAGNPPAFDTVGELEAFFRTVYKPYGWLSDAQWRRLTETSTRRLPDGRVTPHYDPAMVRQFIAPPDDYLRWDALRRARGAGAVPARRDVRPGAARGRRGDAPARPARASVVEIAGCGHAPALNVPEQFALVERFLRGG